MLKGHTSMTSTKMTDFVTSLLLYLQKQTIDLLVKNSRIVKHVKSFKTPFTPFPCVRHKCMALKK